MLIFKVNFFGGGADMSNRARLAVYFLAAGLMLEGCAGLEPFSQEGGNSMGDLERDQLTAGEAAFAKKLTSAPGLNLEELKSQWGQIEKALTRGELTVYRWRQTATVIPPQGQGGRSEPVVFSCLAMFIVNQSDTVVDATSEGRCLDYRLMPAWQPSITQSSGGTRGAGNLL